VSGRIKSLTYRLVPVYPSEFRDPEPLNFIQDGVTYQLADEILTCELNQDCLEIDRARQQIEPFLRSWEIHWGICRNRRLFHFRFESATREVIEQFSPDGCKVVRSETIVSRYAYASSSATLIVKSYEPPPAHFVATPIVEAMWTLYAGYQNGEDRLLPMAYSIYTLLETEGGGNAKSCRDYFRISRNVLETMRRLSSVRGDLNEARKTTKSNSNLPLRDDEKRWLEAVFPQVIRRAGERAANPDAEFEMIEMSSLPKLENVESHIGRKESS
jgi:hypothetical protein